MQVFCRQPFFSLKRESKVNQREETSHGEPMSRTLWWLPDLRIPQHGQTHARRQRTQTHTHTQKQTHDPFLLYLGLLQCMSFPLLVPHTHCTRKTKIYIIDQPVSPQLFFWNSHWKRITSALCFHPIALGEQCLLAGSGFPSALRPLPLGLLSVAWCC